MNIFKNIALSLLIASTASFALVNAMTKKSSWLDFKEYVANESSEEFSLQPNEYQIYFATLLYHSLYDVLENFLSSDRISYANRIKAQCDFLQLLRILSSQELQRILSKQHNMPTIEKCIKIVLKEKENLHPRL